MDFVKEKIINKSIRSTIYIPKMIRMDFGEFSSMPPFQKLNFIVEQNMLGYNYHKLLEFDHVKEIFTEINKIFREELRKDKSERFKEPFCQAISSFNYFITNLTEDKFYLLIEEFESIIELLDKCEDLNIILVLLEILMNLFTIRSRYCEEILLNVSERMKFKFITLIKGWFLALNLGSKNWFKIQNFNQDTVLEDFSNFTLTSQMKNLFQARNEDLVEEETI